MTPPSREVLARNVWRLRTAQGLTQEELAAKIGCSRGRVSQIESGGRPPTLDTVDRVAVTLGVTAAALLTPQAEDGAR